MKFLNLANKVMKMVNESKKSDSDGIADNESPKFPIWLLGGGVGCSIFAIAFVFIIIIAVLIHLGIIKVDLSSRPSYSGSLPSTSSVCKSITVEGYETMSVDEYVAGVINAEVGGYVDDGFNTYKAAAIAARSYALSGAKSGMNGASSDSNGNCYVPNGTSFQAYKPGPDANMVKAANDTSGMVLVNDNKIYFSEYDALCIEKDTGTNYYLCQGGIGEPNMILPKSWIISKQGQAYVDYISQYVHGRGMSQNGAWYLAIERGWNYLRILDYFYGDEGVSLANINGVSGSSNNSTLNGNFISLDNYNLWHNGLTVLNRTLSSEEIDSLNSDINTSVDNVGYGTGEAVASVGQTLIHWLEKRGYYLSYYWGGGQGYGDENNTFVGANVNWGSNKFGDDPDTGNRYRPYLGFDCSGFTSWAVRTACKADFASIGASSWSGLGSVKSISITEAKPGDMLANEGHVILVLKNNGDGSVIAAEAAGGNASGVVFSSYDTSNSSDYRVIDMSGWYKENCNSSR